jgi:hypothetical protein
MAMPPAVLPEKVLPDIVTVAVSVLMLGAPELPEKLLSVTFKVA